MKTKEKIIEEKQFMVVDKVVSMDRGSSKKPPTITFAIQQPCYFSQDAKDEAQRLFDKLMRQQLGGDIKIIGLRLVYKEEE